MEVSEKYLFSGINITVWNWNYMTIKSHNVLLKEKLSAADVQLPLIKNYERIQD